MRISKEGDRYLRTMMVQGAHYILGPFGEDSDLRRWGLKLAARGGKNAKKRAVVAVARKLAVLLHQLAIVVARRSWREISLWKTGNGRKKEKGAKKEGRREMVSKQPSSTAEIR